MNLRKSNLKKLSKGVYDVLILGGGINGAVAAASLSAKGVKVALIDRGDFAGNYPNIDKWFERVEARPAFQSAREKDGRASITFSFDN